MINKYTAKSFCCEDLSLIENYDKAIADTAQTWECHHRGEVLPCGRFSVDDLKKFGLYYNRPAAELIFLTKAEHTRLHKRGIPLSEATKKAMSDTRKGVPKSKEHKKALSEALKGVQRGPMSEAHKKALSDSLKGIPRPYLKGVPKSEATKKAIGEANSKKIQQFTKSGELIKEWQSAMEASRRLGIAQQNICSCCKGKHKSTGGYVWKYV